MKWPFSFPHTIKSWSTVFTIVVSLALWTYAKIQPKSRLGQQKLMAGYRLSSNKNTYLQNYWANVVEYDGGWLSPEINSFLWTKLSQEISQTEFDAISNFYLPMGSSKRGSRNLSDESTKLKIID